MRAFFILTLFFVARAFACEVNLPANMIVIGQESSQGDLRSSGCSPAYMQGLRETLNEVEGKITSNQLSEIMTNKGNGPATITPYMINVQQLRSLVREQLSLPSGVQVKASRGLNTHNLVPLSQGDQVSIECVSCLFGQQQPIKLIVRGFDGQTRTLMAAADFKKFVRAYKLNSSIGAFAEIDPQEMLKEVYVETLPHSDLVSNLEQMKYFKTNKPLKAGDLLKLSDLNAVNLVRAGTKTEVVIENSLVRIKTQGISRSNGALGDSVEIFHQQKNKKYLGKVIDYNKVLVEL